MRPPAGRLLHRPKDKELMNILSKKIDDGYDHPSVPVLNIYDYDPWELPHFGVNTDDREWWFFCPRQGNKRLTKIGYWKLTGKKRRIVVGKKEIGTVRILVFHFGRTPNGVNTGWVMHEFSAPVNSSPNQQGTLVLCQIFDNSNAKGFIIPNYNNNELGSNPIASAVNLMPSYSSFDKGGTSDQFIMNSENQARDEAIPQQQDDCELAPFPVSIDFCSDQNYSLDYASEIWPMKADQQSLSNTFGSFQFISEPEGYLQ